jgi:hypothetical protein
VLPSATRDKPTSGWVKNTWLLRRYPRGFKQR